MLQMDPAANRRMRKQTEDPKTIQKLKWAVLIRSALIVVFAILFIGLMTSLFGSANSSMAVSIFCILLTSRFVGFGYKISDSLVNMGFTFIILVGAPVLAFRVHNVILQFLINFAALFLIILMTCEKPALGNGGLYSFAYIFLCGNPVEGQELVQRFYMAAVGFILCGIVLWRNHRNQDKDRSFYSVIENYNLKNYKCQWQLRLVLGVSLLLTIFEALDLTRYMWAGFACGSLLSDIEVEENIHEKLKNRVIGAVVGSLAFYVVYLILPVNLHPLMGPVGGLFLGLCAEYRHKTMLNCFGALSLAAGLYGLKGAVFLRIGMTLAGVIFALLFFYLYDHFIMSKFSKEEAEAKK